MFRWLAFELDRAVIAFILARDDLDEGRLAGAVTTEECMDLAARYRQIETAQDVRRSEALRDRTCGQQVFRHACLRDFYCFRSHASCRPSSALYSS